MAAAAARGEQTGPGLDRRPPEGDDGNIFTKTLAALHGLATSLPTYVSRIPTKDSLDARQRVLVQSGGSTEQISGPGGDVRLRLCKRAGEGTFCVVFSGNMLPDDQADAQAAGKPVAVKLELRKGDFPQLRDEFRTYRLLHGCHGIPKVHYFGELDFHKALVMDLLGPSLEWFFFSCGRRFTVKTVAMLARQMITRLQAVHEKGLLHRDVKPENFLVGAPGTNNVTTVYLVDFGMAKAYLDPATRCHIPNDDARSLSGTVRYMSINAHGRRTQSRRDDIEALGHVLLFFVRGRLPWQGPRSEDHATRHERMLDRKVATTIQDLCDGYPPEFSEYMTYARGLAFEDEPDYDYLRGLFSKILVNLGFPDDGVYDWMPVSRSSPETKAEPLGVSQKDSASPKAANTATHTTDTTAQPAAGTTAITTAAKLPTHLSKKVHPFFYDSITQKALASLHRDIMADRYKFHRGVGIVDVGRRGRVGGAIRTTSAAKTKYASSVAAHTASLPSNTWPQVPPITDLLASLTGDGDSSSSSGSILPSTVIATAFTDLMDKNLVKVVAELEDMSDKQLQDGDWTTARTRVCGWVDELVGAVAQEQERVRAMYDTWKEKLQAEKLPGTDIRAGDAALTGSQHDDYGLRLDNGGFGSFEVDTALQLEVDDHVSAAKGPILPAATPAGSPSITERTGLGRLSLQGTADPPRGSDGLDDGPHDDSDNPDTFALVFRTASGSRKVVRVNKS